MNKKKKNIEMAYINSPLNNPMQNYRVYYMNKAEKVFVSLIAFIIGGIVGYIFYGDLFMIDGEATTTTYISNVIVFIIVGILATKFLIPIYIKSKLTKQQNKIKSQFCDMLDSLTSSISSGSNVVRAFESATNDMKMQYNEDDFIVREMNEIMNGISQNISVEVMLRNFGERSGNEDIISFADIFEICYRKGGDMQSVIYKTHSVITDKISISDEIETKLTSNKLQHNVMSLMPIAVVAMLRATNDSFAESFASPVGVIVNTIAIAVFIGAYRYGLKIVDIKG